ncbi:MAG: hypothetical protein FJY16_07265 [Bacteroidetes bacterium]|nr:hypothetical protein [Bacteroidota bacterium]
MNKIPVSLFVVAFFGGIYACTHEGTYPNGGIPPPTVSINCHPDSVYFTNEVMPIIASNCATSGCHDAVTRADGVDLTNYTKIMKYVKAGNAPQSKLYKIIIDTDPGDRMPPPPLSPMTATQIAKIKKWIDQGAKNNFCIGSCDTSKFTYAAVIKPIMDNKCVGCHKPGNLGGNVNLSTYIGTKAVALNGTLLGSIAHQSGFSPMPKNSAKLSNCEITHVSRWIAAGSLNN